MNTNKQKRNERIIEEYKKEISIKEIAKNFNLGDRTIYTIINKSKVPKIRRKFKSIIDHSKIVKLNKIKTFRNQGMSYQKIATILGGNSRQSIQQFLLYHSKG